MPLQTWHADHGTLRLHLPRCTAALDLLNPALGLHDVRVDGRPFDKLSLLAVDIPPVTVPDGETPGAIIAPRDEPQSLDYFVRGGDLAVSYVDRPENAMRTQIYWRARTAPARGVIAAIELLVSVQTSLLDSCPTLYARSTLAAQAAFRCSLQGQLEEVAQGQRWGAAAGAGLPGGFVLRLPGTDVTYAEMAHPADARLTTCAWDTAAGSRGLQLGHELFAERLEKGVILRARVLGVLLDRANDADTATAQFSAFLTEQLPLTT